MAEWTGLEPATPGVTGRYSNQLNYHSSCPCWWVLTGSNRRHSPCKGDALPTELSTLCKIRLHGPIALSLPRSSLAVLPCTVSGLAPGLRALGPFAPILIRGLVSAFGAGA